MARPLSGFSTRLGFEPAPEVSSPGTSAGSLSDSQSDVVAPGPTVVCKTDVA